MTISCVDPTWTIGWKANCKESNESQPKIKISVNTDISVIEFYENIGNIENIGKISVDIFTKISVIKIFHILII